ncbi:hypothetical protein LTR16_002376 [Cryomyces antarcticus]|uniref:NAD(P)-binding domain-containing protein n=1 Tax=Cryomyces antarcticus TaxID=329879 RepID=A0ABR0M9F1_9PEZI|nr:hypothetical protein LTR39_004706 [Cryomyces antarcticus]KAK5016973.1 hypothetical protein LTR60_002143 [Cryomyces antarcticus]KAK5291035.1 hypothetical protein LTR16_002376 [Cryomyces antarcticus]
MAPHILLLGGHGKVAQLLTPMLLQRSWTVTSLIRNPEQSDAILNLGKSKPGELNVLVRSLEEVKSDEDAKSVLEEVKPDWVIWSAGAGGKGGASRTFATDRDAARHFISSSLSTPSIKKFMMISYLGSRRNKPSWWSDAEWSASQQTIQGGLKNYFEAKVDADEYLAAMAHKREQSGDKTFQAICLRPGGLTDEPAGKVQLGKTVGGGKVSRASVAEVAAALTERDDTRGWYDLLDGDEDVATAVERVAEERVDCIEGEDLDAIYNRAT